MLFRHLYTMVAFPNLTQLKMFIQFNVENRRCDLFSGSLIACPLHLKLCELPVFELLKCYKHEVSLPKQVINNLYMVKYENLRKAYM